MTRLDDLFRASDDGSKENSGTSGGADGGERGRPPDPERPTLDGLIREELGLDHVDYGELCRDLR